MIKALPHQQHPSNVCKCPFCGSFFNNLRRTIRHMQDKAYCKTGLEDLRRDSNGNIMWWQDLRDLIIGKQT